MRRTLLPAEMGGATGWVTMDAAVTLSVLVDVMISLGRVLAPSASFFWLAIKASSTAYTCLKDFKA